MSQLVQLDHTGPVSTLTLNRPQRHNSLVPALLEEILVQIEEIRSRQDTRTVILQANGRSFSTGGDLRGFYEHLDTIEEYARKIVGLLNRVILSLLDLPVPIVAAVQGIVTGGSMGLVLASDIILVTPQASFTPYYSIVGFSPDGGWTALLPTIIGHKRTTAVLMHNQTITAEQALVWGLAHQIVDGQRIRQEALRLAQDIASKKSGSIRYTKRLLVDGYGDLANRLEKERSYFVHQIMTPEAQQGIRTFLNQRGREAG